MNNQDMKIYFDGSHYIGIPKGAFPSKKGRKRRVVKPMQQTQKEQTVETPPETTKERFEKAYKDSQSLPKQICTTIKGCQGQSFCRSVRAVP